MNHSEPVVNLDPEQMDALDKVARKAGTTGEALFKDIFHRVLLSLEQAQGAYDPVHGSFACNVLPIRPGLELGTPEGLISHSLLK